MQLNKETVQHQGDILSLSRNTQDPARQTILESSFFLDNNVVHEGSTATLEAYKNDFLRT